LAAGNNFPEAESEYEEVIRIKPDLALAHLDAGVMLAREGRFDPALKQFEETLRLEPGNKMAHDYVLRVQGWKERR
jgi:Flp pilus assembly protein TadD